MPRFLRIRSRLGALFEPQRVLFSIPLKASYARKAGGSAICKKREENSLAALPIVYLFFIIYSKSTVGQFTNLKFIQHYFFSSQCFLHIDDSLILTSLPMKFSIKFFLYKRSIYDHIAIFHNIQCLDLIPAESCIQPDCFLWKCLFDLFR